MKVLLVAILVVVAAATAHAQAPALDAFLEQRATEELAADGQVLSRLNVSLDIELIGDRAVVTLIDLATGRAVASSKIEALPADRDAAVATVTQVVANLVAQIGGAKEAKAPVTPAVDPAVELEERAKQRELAERQYLEQKIGFGVDTSVSVTGNSATVTQSAFPWQGELQVRLTPKQFYDLVERPDLYSAHRRRMVIKIGGFLGGLAFYGIGAYVGLRSVGADCDLGTPGYQQCQDDLEARQSRDLKWMIALMSIGTIGIGVGYFTSAHAIDESEAKQMAAEYNRKLRTRLQLPNASREQRAPIRDIRWSPYAAPGGGGMFVAGRF